MTYENFASLVRKYAKANSTTLPDADIATYLNALIEDLSMLIEDSNPTYFEKVFTTNLTLSTRNYALDLTILSNIKKVEIKTDTGSTTLYQPVQEINIDTLPVALQETEIRDYMSGYDPLYGIRGGELWLLTEEAIVAVTNGLKIYANIYPQTISSGWFTGTEKSDDMSKAQTSGSFGVPRQFHELLARGLSIQYKSNQDRPLPLSAKEQLFESDLAKKIHLTKKLTPAFTQSVPYDDGSDY